MIYPIADFRSAARQTFAAVPDAQLVTRSRDACHCTACIRADPPVNYPIRGFLEPSATILAGLYVGYRTEEAVKKRDRSNWTAFGRTMSIR